MQKIKNFFTYCFQTKLLHKFCLMFVLSLIVLQADTLPLFAEVLAKDSEVDLSTQDFLTNVIGFLTTSFKVIQQVLWPVLLLTGPLLDNSLIYGPGIEDRLFDIWTQFRNLTNLIIAILLVGVTLYNLLGIGEGGSYELKSFFKKMVIALVAINFSFFGARLILDASNVVTTFAFSLPNTVQSHSADAIGNLESSLCSTMQDIGAGAASDVFGAFSTFGLQGSDSPTFCNGTSLTTEARAFFSRVSASNLAMIMAGNYANISEGLQASKTLELTLDITNMTINSMLSLVIIFLHGAAYISLFFVLLVRLVFLWLAIAVSPLVVFASIMGISAFDQLSKLYDEFFTHAFAPAKVGFALSISYIIFSAIEKNGLASQGTGLGVGLTYPFSGISTLEKFLVTIGAAVVVYDVALEVGSSTRASFITNSIQAFARNRVGMVKGIAAKIPLGSGAKGALTWGSLGKSFDTLEKGIKDYGDSSTDHSDPIYKKVFVGKGDTKITKDEFKKIAATPSKYKSLKAVHMKQAASKLNTGQFTDTRTKNMLAAINSVPDSSRKTLGQETGTNRYFK